LVKMRSVIIETDQATRKRLSAFDNSQSPHRDHDVRRTARFWMRSQHHPRQATPSRSRLEAEWERKLARLDRPKLFRHRLHCRD